MSRLISLIEVVVRGRMGTFFLEAGVLLSLPLIMI
jgi:hypothetical protein